MLVVGVCSLALMGGVAFYVATLPKETPLTKKDVVQDRKPTDDVKVYSPRYDKGELKLDPGTVKPPEKADPKVFAVNSYLKNLGFVPKGAALKSCVVKDGQATLDFNSAFETTYGTEDEQTVVKGLMTTMAQFSDVHTVLMTVEGKPLETLGNIDLTQPLPVPVPEKGDASPQGVPPPDHTSRR